MCKFPADYTTFNFGMGSVQPTPKSRPNCSRKSRVQVRFPFRKNSGLKFHVPSVTVHSGCTDSIQLSHCTFGKIIVLASRIQKSGTWDNNFLKWEGTFWSNLLKWLNWSKRTIIKAGPEYSGQIKLKWSFPFDNIPTKIIPKFWVEWKAPQILDHACK